jgi:hypothetical protein
MSCRRIRQKQYRSNVTIAVRDTEHISQCPDFIAQRRPDTKNETYYYSRTYIYLYVTEILLKVALNTINSNPTKPYAFIKKNL